MIASIFRVPRQLIPSILRKGEELRTDLFIVRYFENKEQFSRYRAIISKKIERKAVARNKLRRQIYEAIRINQEKSQSNRDYILIPKKKIIHADFQAIAADISTKITL